MVRTGGLEPPTSRLSGERSNRLSYARSEADNLLKHPAVAEDRKRPTQSADDFYPANRPDLKNRPGAEAPGLS